MGKGVGGLDNWTIFMGIIHVSSLKITHVYVFNNLIIKRELNFFKINVITFYTNEWNICVFKEENEKIISSKSAVKVNESILLNKVAVKISENILLTFSW